MNTVIKASAKYDIDIVCLDAPDGHPEKYSKTYKGTNKILPGMLEALGFGTNDHSQRVRSNIYPRHYREGAVEVPLKTPTVTHQIEKVSDTLDRYTIKIDIEGNYNPSENSSNGFKLNFYTYDNTKRENIQINEMNIPEEILEPLDKEGYLYFIKIAYTLTLDMPRIKGQIQVGQQTIDYETYFVIDGYRTIVASDVVGQSDTDKITPSFISPSYTGFIEDGQQVIVPVKYYTPETGLVLIYYKFSKPLPKTEKVVLNLSKLNIRIENKR